MYCLLNVVACLSVYNVQPIGGNCTMFVVRKKHINHIIPYHIISIAFVQSMLLNKNSPQHHTLPKTFKETGLHWFRTAESLCLSSVQQQTQDPRFTVKENDHAAFHLCNSYYYLICRFTWPLLAVH